jgi:hypothetical protein
MKFASLALSLIFLGCGPISQSQSHLNGADELSTTEQDTLKQDLHLIFKDPESALQPTHAYQEYLTYLKNREAITDKMSEATTDAEIITLSMKLNRLDQDFTLFNIEIKKTVERVMEIGFRLYKDSKNMETIKSQRQERYNEWQIQREGLVEKIKNADADKVKLQFAQKLNRLDSTFKIEFLGLLLH